MNHLKTVICKTNLKKRNKFSVALVQAKVGLNSSQKRHVWKDDNNGQHFRCNC